MQTLMATPAAVNTLPIVHLRNIPLGERIYAAGSEGIAWRVRSGAVRLDRLVLHYPRNSLTTPKELT